MNFTIRKAVRGDNMRIRPLQDEIAKIHLDGRPDLFRAEARYHSDEEFEAMLADDGQFIYIAESDDGETAGYVFAKIIKYRNHPSCHEFDSFYIDDICVAEKFRRNGIGRRFIELCRGDAETAGCKNVDLGVYCFNADAIAFYESCGFKPRTCRMEIRL